MDLIKLVGIFVLIVVFMGLKKPLYLVMTGATVLLALAFQMPILDFLICCGNSLISPDTINLVLVIWLVMLVEGVMSKYGYMQHILSAMDNVFNSRKFDMALMPMIIGLLPSAGGALFSCPMVEEASAGTDMSAENKTVVNVYYRHIMEIFFPTYPAILLAAQLTGISLGRIAIYTLPMAVVMILVGLLYMRGVPKLPKAEFTKSLPARLGALLLAMWPFLVLMVLIMAVGLEVWISVGATLLLLLIVIRPPLKTLPQLLGHSTQWRLLLMTASVMVFKDVLAASGSVDALPELIGNLPIAPLFVFSLMSFFITLLTGMPITTQAIVLPLFITTVPAYGVPAICLLHLSAYCGAQVTPTHLCIPISSEYFHADLQKVLFRSLPVYLPMYIAAILVYGLLLA